jgi:hypothetical protein
MGFLKILTSLHTRLAAETHLAGGEVLEVLVNGGVSESTRKNLNTINIQKRWATF